MPASDDAGLTRFIGLRSATGLVVANMIGAGIFTTTGFQAADLGHPGLIYGLWILGGVLAFCGALCFAELGAMLPRAGAEYVYIRESYGQALAFVSAFVALTAGFSAPIAAAAKSFAVYLGYLIDPLRENPPLFGVALVDLCAIGVVPRRPYRYALQRCRDRLQGPGYCGHYHRRPFLG
jgi:APA family basic amino acid/polyamine antiporter